MPSLFPEPDQPHVPTPRINPDAWVLAHCDGGARGNPGPAGYGAVLTDEQGLVLAELSEFLGIRSNNVAEYAGLLGALNWTRTHGYRRLRVVSDSLLMVNQMTGRFKVNSPDLKPMWEEAKRISRSLDAFEITHALRHKNKTADRLANEAMDRGMGRQRQTVASPAPLRATPYPSRAAAPPEPPPEPAREAPGLFAEPRQSCPAPSQTTWRGVIRGGRIELLEEATLPEGASVHITLA